MRSLNALLWRNLTAHPLRSILTALAITLGVGMVLAAAIVGQAAGLSASELSEEGPHVDLEVFSRDGASFDAAVLDRLRASPDVERVSSSLRVEVEGVDPEIPSLTLLGVDPEPYLALHELELAGGTFLNKPDTIVLPMMIAIDSGLSVGDEITLAAEGRAARLTVAGRLKLERDVTALVETRVAYVPLSVAQTLRGSEEPKGLEGQIDRVEIALSPGADVGLARVDLAERVGPDLAVVRAVMNGGTALTDSIVQLGLAMVGGMMLFAAAFVITNAFAMSVTARTQEIGAMRALGMTRRQVMRVVLAEAVLMGLVGATLGVLIGIGLAWGAMRALGTLDDGGFAIPWWGVALSTAMGMTVTLAGALQPARRASRVSPLVAMRSQRVKTASESSWYVRQGGRVGALILAILLPALATVGLVLRPDFYVAMALIGVGQIGLLAATVLLLPALVSPMARLARPGLVRWLGAAGRLATDNLGRNKLRAVLTAGALTAALTTIVATSGLLPLTLEGGLTGFLGLLNEDGMVGPDAAALIASGEWSLDNAYEKMTAMPLDPRVLQALEPLAEAGAIEVERIGFASVPSELTSIPGSPGTFVDPEIFLRIGNFDFFEGDPATALEWMERGRAVLLGPIPAERLGATVGDEIPVQTPHGEVEFTVAGIGGTGTNFPVFPYTDGEAHFDMAGTTWVGIIVPDGQDVDAALVQVENALEALGEVGAGMMNLDTLATTFFEVFERLQMLLNALLLLAVVVASLGVVNTMVVNVAERRREIALLRAVGATQRQVRWTIVAEAATLGLMAAVVGTVVSVAFLGLFVLVMTPGGTYSMGFRVSWELAASTLSIGLHDLSIAAGLSLVFGPLVAALAAYYPARQAAAMDVVEATRSERVTLKPTGAKRPESRPKMARSLTWTMAWRNLGQNRLRTTLSALAVALGAAMIVTASVTSEGVRSGVQASEVSLDATAWMTDLLEASLNGAGVAILIAAGFVIFNAFAMAITQRRRQIGALRALGMTRGCKRSGVMRVVLVEALIIGSLGTLLGLVAGPVLGNGLLAVMRHAGIEIGQGSASLASLALAIVMGIGITLLSVLVPARRATRISPLVALRQETVFGIEHSPLGRVVLGLLIITGLTAYLVTAPPGEWTLPPWDTRMPLLLSTLWLVALLMILPALVGGLGRVIREPLTRLAGATGRLVADNLGRGRRRVTLTILTLAVGLTMIVSVTGVVTFMFTVLFTHLTEGALREEGWIVVPIDMDSASPVMALEIDEFDLETLFLEPEVVEDFYSLAEGRAEVGEGYAVIAPEIGAMMSNYPSFIYNLDILTRPSFYTFAEGDWDRALPVMEAGCGLLISPGVAARNQVGIGDTITLQGVVSPIECTVAGLGAGGYHPASFVSPAAKDAFGVSRPAALVMFPLPGTDREALEADLVALAKRHGAMAGSSQFTREAFTASGDLMVSLMNSLLLLAVLAAALGVVNTTVMSVAERQRELGLLRAVGATRQQVSAVVMGEAALMGLIGGVLGLVAGAGVSVIFAVSFGGNSFGVPDLPLWDAAWRATQPALLTGLLGLIAAPIISAGAAWLPVRSILRGPAIGTMQPERQRAISPRRAAAGFLGRGSIRTRFVLGTAALMAIVLAGLVGVVTIHARVRIEEQTHDALRTMVAWNAGMIELGLPDDAQTLEFDSLMGGGGAFDFDSDALLRFESLADDMTANGLVGFTVADRDDVVLVSLDTREVGTLAPELETTAEADVYSEREGDEWLMHASAPVRNEDDLVVGSVRLTVDARKIQDFLGKLRNTLWAIGAVIVLVGVAVSWGLGTPLVRATHQLAAHAAGVGRGEHTLFPQPHTPKLPHPQLSLRAKLTIALVLIVAVMVAALEVIAIPIERRHVEGTLKDNLVAAAEWVGQAASESFDAELSGLPTDEFPTFEELLDVTKMGATLDLARLQELGDHMRSNDAAFVALVNEEGTVIISDQLALVGEEVALPSDTQVEESTWRGEDVWVVSTPLRKGQDGGQLGALHMAVRRERVEAFLDESRNLFRLTGLIAVLAGVLLAQAIGGAVTAPVRRLAAGTRRVAEGDLTVQFDLHTKDELAMLANAYNQMVVGLQEREWLRDMFGRFVSREVADAIRAGQVKLEGENRVVSVLFCDIRDFTARSERCTPEEMVALLNEYLPVVVEAAQEHQGTVNKFGGDSTLVIYGAPRPVQDSAYQAVSTALEMRASLKRLNDRLAERDEAPVRVGVGINTGAALAGAVGPPERQEYTVIGDAVNLASRIEALNRVYPEHDILISGWTYEALGSRRTEFEFVDLGEIEIRGKMDPVRVWAVVGRKNRP